MVTTDLENKTWEIYGNIMATNHMETGMQPVRSPGTQATRNMTAV
jgi:hypothetical protein